MDNFKCKQPKLSSLCTTLAKFGFLKCYNNKEAEFELIEKDGKRGIHTVFFEKP